jgi:hypothetical protein
MTRPVKFRQSDVRRAIAVAKESGLSIAAIRPDGTLITYDSSSAHPLAPDLAPRQDADDRDLDDELAEFEASHARDTQGRR